MLPAYRLTLEQAKSRRKETKDFLERLRKRRPADLDAVTNRLHEEAFGHIDCLQCGNCCQTTGPLLLNKDVERLAAHFRIRPAEFTERYLREDEDRDYVFRSMPCPFLGADNYCSVYENRPNACREFPHTQQRDIREKLGITYHNTMICPAVAEVVEGLKQHYR
jgi:hypothetical protein